MRRQLWWVLMPLCVGCSRDAERLAPAAAPATSAAPTAQATSESKSTAEDEDGRSDAPDTSAAASAQASAAGPAQSPPPDLGCPAKSKKRAGKGGSRKRPVGLGTIGGAAKPQTAVALPDMRACAKRCYAENQMRAVSPEQIEADCRKSCHAECLRYCEQKREGTADTFEETCRQDCDAQASRLASGP